MFCSAECAEALLRLCFKQAQGQLTVLLGIVAFDYALHSRLG